MIEAYAIGVAATLEDGVTPPLLRIIDSLMKANALMLDFAENVRRMSRAGLSLSGSLGKAAEASTALGDSSAGLTRASYVLDTMAASSADLARNLAAARTEGAGMLPTGGGGGGGSGGSGSSRSSRNNRTGKAAAGAAALTILGGVYENARLDDTNASAVATSQLNPADWASGMADLRKREMEYASKYAYASGGRIAPFAEAMLEGSRLLRTLPAAKQGEMMDTVMPYAALEAKLKGVPLPEAVQAFVGLAHQAGAYSKDKAAPLFESMVQASLTSHASLSQIARAASYALPALHAAGANSSDVMMLIATMMQGGIMNTKSGTWLNAMAMNALPNTLGSGLFKNGAQNNALHMLGLYKGNKSQFYKNGNMDLMQLVSILAQDRTHMEPLKFNALLKQSFGTQGQRAASFFSEDTTLGNLTALQGLKSQEQNPNLVRDMLRQMSPIAKADQTIANANITLMNATTTFMGPVNAILDGASSFFSKTAPLADQHPVLAGAGIATGAFAAMVAGKMALGAVAEAAGIAAAVLTGPVLAAIAGAAAIAAGAWWIHNNATTKGDMAAMNPGYHRPDAGDPNIRTPAGEAERARLMKEYGMQPTIHVHNHIDSKEVASVLIPHKSIGPSGFNQSAHPMPPGMNLGWGSN
jgi:hypothetical protein